jgi:hypothetical protein
MQHYCVAFHFGTVEWVLLEKSVNAVIAGNINIPQQNVKIVRI